MISNCCGVEMPDYPESDICPRCKEHTEGIDEEKKEMIPKKAKSNCFNKEKMRRKKLNKEQELIKNLTEELEEKLENIKKIRDFWVDFHKEITIFIKVGESSYGFDDKTFVIMEDFLKYFLKKLKGEGEEIKNKGLTISPR